MSSKMQWRNRTITDAVGDSGSVTLDEELVARAVLADWLDVEYDLDEDSEAWLMDVLTGVEITYEDREVLRAGYGIYVEFTD